MDNKKIIVFDTTLRDGEQAAGFRLGSEEKLEIAHQLAKLRVDVIEAGFPISSDEDFKAVQLISQEIDGPAIAALSRAVTQDIEACAKALADAKRPRIHTGIGVSDIHIVGKFRDSKYGTALDKKKERVFQMAVEAITTAKKYVDDVEFYAEDAGRADRDYLFRVIEGVIAAGATVVNIPDTTGYTVPEQFGALIRSIRENVPNIDKAVISVHCHNDLGMATINTLTGVKNGAQQVECTINGIGERAGNASLEEVVMSMHVRRDYFGLDTDIDIKELYQTSQMVARRFGIPVPPNKAVVGSNAFAHSSGIHVDGFLKSRETYEIMRPEDVGFPQSKLILTARSGRHALRHRLEGLGIKLTPEKLDKAYKRFLTIADKVQEVSSEMLVAIVEDEIPIVAERYHLEHLRVTSETGMTPTATVTIKVANELKQATSGGDGPVDATYKAINEAIGASIKLADFTIHAIASGADTLGEVTVKIRDGDDVIIGRGSSTDIIEASAKAYIDGLNKLASRKGA
ncbi:MAG: 2-isopropylmalate synthase [Candidatus Aureabacteria bacterium]|nr:2-isopropylmalate synthase [Candidatus Auribacterota bacterium]